jgi:hypothetical protein
MVEHAVRLGVEKDETHFLHLGRCGADGAEELAALTTASTCCSVMSPWTRVIPLCAVTFPTLRRGSGPGGDEAGGSDVHVDEVGAGGVHEGGVVLAEELGDQFAAAVDVDLGEDRLEVVADGVGGQVQPLGVL